MPDFCLGFCPCCTSSGSHEKCDESLLSAAEERQNQTGQSYEDARFGTYQCSKYSFPL